MLKSHEKFHSTNGKRLVLVAEDEEINRELLGTVLKEDYEVLFASDGLEALKLIQEHQNMLSIILLDLVMPKMGGLELLEKLKSDHTLQLIPVIVLTSDQESEIKSLTLGAADFIPKPYPPAGVMLARIRRTIELFEDRITIQTTERDPLTNLYNREFFYHYAGLFDQYHESIEMDAIIIDIYHFRVINERFGDAYGDEVLKRIGLKVREMVADTGGIVCRREADTFMIYCPHGKDYKKILESASDGLTGEDVPRSRIRLRMGVYEKADRSIPIERRFDRAQMAADMIRNSFNKSIEFYDHRYHEIEVFEQQLLESFQQGLSREEFRVYYQPKFDIRGEEPVLVSAEGLVRWINPQFGFISPGDFIPLFEKNGLIEELDVYVWEKTAKQIRDWKDRLGYSVPVSVNVSRVDMYDPHLAERLKDILEKYGLSPEDILLEVTESAYTRDSEQIIDSVNGLRNMGFRIEMDDFGNGYSSLNMLSTLPIDALKLDMDFVQNTFRRRKDTRMLEIIIDIADYLSVPVIAEGVETQEQVKALRAIGCDIVQGFYFSRPVPAEEFEKFLRKRKEAGIKAELSKKTAAALEKNTRNQTKEDIITFVGIAKALAQDYFSIYVVDAESNEYYEYQSEKSYRRLGISKKGEDFFKESRENALHAIYSEDQVRFLNHFTKENIMKRLKEKGVFMMTYRILIDGAPTFVSMKISRLRETGRNKLVAGVSNINAGIEERDKALTYSDITKALGGNYVSVYCVELDSGEYEELASHDEFGLPEIEKTGNDFFAGYEEEMLYHIHPDDREAFLQGFNKEMIRAAVDERKAYHVSYRQRVNGKWMHLQMRVTAAANDREDRVVISISSIDEQKRLEEEHIEAIRQINRDALTGVKSRHSYIEDEWLINEEIERGTCGEFAVVFCDLNGLKRINDTYGHAEGDEFIKEACRTICHIYKHSPVYRVGGDEFIAILRNEDYTNREYLSRMMTALNYAQTVGRKVVVACGMAEYRPGEDQSLRDVYKRADAAMYENKKKLKQDLDI